jgi:hypothetical protein
LKGIITLPNLPGTCIESQRFRDQTVQADRPQWE